MTAEQLKARRAAPSAGGSSGVSALLLFLITASALGQPVSPRPAKLPLPTRVEQIRRLTPDRGKLGYPARLRAFVTYYGAPVVDVSLRTAQLEEPKVTPRLTSLRAGSRVELTRICTVRVDKNRVHQSFQLLLRSPDDVVLLERHPWWTLKHALWAFGLLGVIILAAIAWGEVLRRQVNEQTEVIREWLRREAQLKEQYRELFENANDMVFTCGLRRHFTSLNKAGERITGYTRGEALGMNIEEVLAPEYAASIREMMAQKLGPEGQRTFEVEILAKDGQRVPVEINTRLIYSEGLPMGVQAIVREMTERKRGEEQLQRAKEVAEAASRAKSEFVANMSHEIRTPLNAIIGMTELALDTDLTAEQRESLETVKTSSESLLTVINDILDFSKIEAGKFGFDRIVFNLRDSLGETMRSLALRAHQKSLELVYRVDPRAPEHLEGDPTRLRQVIANLVGNAIKFTERGEVVLKVEAESQTENDALLLFNVTDTGIGIPREKQRIIFEAFAQADGTTTRQFGGTGLGLTISSQLVEMMGGRIWVESDPGQGSTFSFTARFALPKAPVKGFISQEPVRLQDMTVLVVDDNATSRRILEEMLANWRMKPAMADGGWTALAAMQRARDAGKPYPLVLLDAQMPDMDGFALAERIKKDPTLAGAMVMMLTSAGQRGDAARCRELGIVVYLMKPVRQPELLNAILLALGQVSQRPKRTPLITRHTLREARRKLRILLAEDNLVNRRLAVRMLEKRGHVVLVAGNGREVLETLKNQAIDLVLMDVQMPELDGLETTAAIRKGEKGTGRHLPIVAMTAHAMKGDRERCLTAGMDGYVSKPVKAEQLFKTIEEIVASGAGAAAVAGGVPPPDGVLDADLALARLDGDRQLLKELVKVFQEEWPRMRDEIWQAIAERNLKALGRAAHTLKGSVGNFAAPAAFDAALKLELIAHEGDLTQAEEACARLQEEIERLYPALEELGKDRAN